MASSSAPQASHAWRGALKIRKCLLKDLEKLQVGSDPGIDASQFEGVDSLLEKFRLGCVSTIFLDFDYAVAENTEEALWLTHTSINSEYRRVLGRLKQSSNTVERRKVEKMYNNFLRIAQKFYRGYVQRLSARYDIPELKRVAHGIEVEQLDVENKISPVSADLQSKVLKSCHSTLIRLGDLARYRVQARYKNSGYETALAYYSLAHHLKPHSGFAFHQMGIVNLDQGNHLDIVYHFYRAWAVETPHPNAKSNLEAEFKASLKSRHSPSTAQEAFTRWFVRLHAYFYKGEAFQQQGELEGEVMHRLEMAGRSKTSADSLLKMALVNMSAHHIATLKYAEKQTNASLRFYQYTLRFNALYVSTFSKVLETELKETISSVEGVSDQSDAAKKTSAVESLLPVLRICCIWLAAHRREVFGTADAFGAVVPAMVHNLARVFTLLCVETYSQEHLTTCPYLLPEDTEILGLRPLGDDQVPEPCRLYCGEDGKTKPYSQTPDRLYSTSVEKSGRILDILRCAYFLAEDNEVPLTYRIERNSLVFEHQLAPSSNQLPVITAQGPIQATDASQTLKGGLDVQVKHASPAQEKSAIAAPGIPKSHVVDVGELSRDTSSNGNYELSRDVDDAENTVINMLAPFLKPPTPQPQQPRSPEEASHGMHAGTAVEVLSALEVEPSPTKSIPSGKFEPLPWDWFNTPNPHKGKNTASSAGQDAFNGRRSATHSPHTSVTAGKPLEDPFATPGRHVAGAFARHVASDVGSPSSFAAQRAHQERLLQTNKASAPRSSSFGQWSQNQNVSGHLAPVSLAWGSHGLENVPFSSSLSGFSQSNSLYQGTPANRLLHTGPFNADFSRSISHDTTQRENGSSLVRHFRMDKTTSNYDEAILKAAYHGSR